MNERRFLEAIALDEGPLRVAALATWIQSLAPTLESRPVLVGGAAVELYSGGAYRTGDLDFVGSLGKDAARRLEEVGFQKQGRHWVHEEQRIFLEFPGTALEKGDDAALIQVGEHSVLVIGLEELIVNRLDAWQLWRSEVDGVNAFRLARSSGSGIDWSRLRELAELREVSQALDALERFVAPQESREPTADEIVEWAREAPDTTR